MGGDFLVPAYLNAFSASVAALKSLGIPVGQLCELLESFNGVPGRGEVLQVDDTWVVRDRNPGVSSHSVEFLVNILEEYYHSEDIGLVVEPISPRVCQKLNLDDLSLIEQVHDSVTGAYLMGSIDRVVDGFQAIDELGDVTGDHEVMLHCTKEGYL
jgi:hypothetical protein